jgi:hypothetical protein
MTATIPRSHAAPPTRSRSRLRVGIAVTAVLVIAAVAGYTIWSGASADPRRYPDEGNALAVPAAPGSMDDALRLFGLSLPCGTSDVRYRDDKPVVGSGGTLHLRFATSRICLGDFLGGINLSAQSLHEARPGDPGFPFAAQDRADYAEDFGWSFDPARRYSWQVTQSSKLVQTTLVVDGSQQRPVVYLVADRSEPE